MVLAVGATGLVPWLAVELAAELAGTRGAEELDAAATVANLLAAFDAGLRKTLARMGISTASSYIGGKLFETIELDDDVRVALLPGGAGVAGPGRLRRPRRPPAPPSRGRPRGRRRRRPRTSSRTRGSPGSGPTARSTATPRRSSPRSRPSRGSRRLDVVPAAPRRPSTSGGPTVVRDALRVRRPRGAVADPLRRGRVRPARSSAASSSRRCPSAPCRPRPTRR